MNPPVPPLSPARPATAAGPGSADATRQALMRGAWRDVALVAGGLLLAALAAAWAAGLGGGYVLKALAWLAAGAVVISAGLRAGMHPHARFGNANRITLLRLALAGLLVGLLGEAAWSRPLAGPGALAWAVVVLATVTALLDAADGALARRSGLASAFGARFDMETDAAYTVVLCALVWQAGQAGLWVLLAGLMRYGFVAAAWGWPWLAAPLPPSRRRQAVCVAQITTLIVCLAPVVSPALATLLAAASLALLAGSFAVDVQFLARTRRPRLER
jgi:phosphatidylglycerophosphate synthase